MVFGLGTGTEEFIEKVVENIICVDVDGYSLGTSRQASTGYWTGSNAGPNIGGNKNNGHDSTDIGSLI